MPSPVYQVGNLPSHIKNLEVTHFRLVAHTMGPVAPGAVLSQNHWSIYLLHAEGSVRFNMQLEDPSSTVGTRGLLTVTDYQYTTPSTSAVKYWDFSASHGLTVRQVARLIQNKGRADYEMNERGVGCRYWIVTVMADHVAKNYVSAVSDDGISVADIIGYNYSIDQLPIPLEVQSGTFLSSGDNPSLWSQWEWTNEFDGQWYRYRMKADGTYEYEYQKGNDAH